ncbi:tRNA-(ms[2]io[6]A)-hydroxylase [Psychrobium sp. 1_MG-2023]|uniref:tRNA-(ms[2]io[6]A)-hydroxylase n=1 Tax=Psychrobium sp. 1_MG-2023 TaxID=3062624 RepID=UPI000C33413D|nr:tRNA-(ms[2]io[6]A)-hydroxylase [Psychrobium sp. 1_MG-2023]MDP2561211.1 tRNA-(ms[2]io[6]A)-hydroxylase [Psychrobium sp. 1_MG-2023]PKF55285.1 tRNA-(ms[2]io[6]A)-hydroxylase [Alteromonadales bacterium alter-6D02]
MFELKFNTPAAWTEAVLANFDYFLQDHAAAEKKASGMAISMLSHYQDRPKLVRAMTDLALEELIHFKQVLKLMTARDVLLRNDTKDLYIKEIRALCRHPRDQLMMDRLLIAGIIEARGYERFSLVADALEAGKDQEFYAAIAKSEAKHKDLFVELAYEYFDKESVDTRLEELLIAEAKICEKLPFTGALH